MNANVQYLRRATEIRFARLCGWTVDVAANRVQRGESDLRLTPKAMAVLRELMQRQGTVVRRDDLLGIVWRDGFPTDDVLTHAVTELRRALEDEPRAPKIIETIPKVGYRLLAPVEIIDAPTPPNPYPAVDQATEAAPPPPSEPDRAPWPLWAALAALALLAIGLPLVQQRARAPDTARPAPSSAAAPSAAAPAALQPVALTSDVSREQFPSLSPDGSTVVYTALATEGTSSRILVKSLDPSAQPVALTEPAMPLRDDHPVWSPDGKQIGFLRMTPEDCSVMVIAASGGRPRKVATCIPRFIDYFDWTSDSRGLLVTHRGSTKDGVRDASTIERVDLDTGARTPIAYEPKPTGAEDLQPKSSPDGRMIAFRRGAAPYSDLYVMPADGGTAQRVTALRTRIRGYAWESDSAHLVFSSGFAGRQELYRIPITGGDAVPLGAPDAHFPAIARNAPVLVYQQESGLMQLSRVTLGEEGGKASQLIAPSSRSDWFPVLSPSGGKLAFVSMRSGSQQLWIHEFDSGATYPVSHVDNADVAFPQWSPDETQVMFITRARGESAMHRVQLASAHVERLSAPGERVRFASYARDGKSIFYSSDRNGNWQIWRMSPDGTGASVVVDSAGFDPRDFLGDGSIYYVKETDSGLFRYDMASRTERRVSWLIGYWNMDSLLVRDDGLYYLESSSDDGHTWLMKSKVHLDGLERGVAELPGASATERLFDLHLPQAGAEASISPDLTRVVAVMLVRDETDLMTARM